MQNPLDVSIIRRRAILRKGLSFAMRSAAVLQLAVTPAHSWQTRPPIIVNSLPKSGTHLLLQLVRALPRGRYRGGFIASSPSLSQKPRSPGAVARRLDGILPGECLGGHLYHSNEAELALRDRNFLSLFICRDPRDVLISELHYLTEMNHWHRMHRHYACLPDFQARLTLALEGLDNFYPECNQRFLPYAAWMKSEGTYVIRYEELTGTARRDVLQDILDRFMQRGGQVEDPLGMLSSMEQAADPSASHTFREGGSGKWSRGISDEQAWEITQRLAPSLAAFGYAQ